jgi:hypothetical protein
MKIHPRIYPANYGLLRELPPDHPAVRTLQVHAEASDLCVGKEINWPHLNIIGIDQKWFSDVDFREWRFSDFAYQFISYDLVLDGWIESALEATEAELGFIEIIPKMRTLLDECEQAACEEKNSAILPLVAKAREFIDAFEGAIRYRAKQYGFSLDL